MRNYQVTPGSITGFALMMLRPGDRRAMERMGRIGKVVQRRGSWQR